MYRPEIQTIRHETCEPQPVREAMGKVDMKTATLDPSDDLLGCDFGSNQCWHGEVVAGSQWRLHEARIDEIHADTARSQIEV